MDAMPRFNGAEAWARLPPERQAEAGALALELGVAIIGLRQVAEMIGGGLGNPHVRAVEASYDRLSDEMSDVAAQFMPESPLPPVPSLLGNVCNVCGCSEDDACEGGCAWAGPGRCSACPGEITS
jgi:hypothetical protein